MQIFSSPFVDATSTTLIDPTHSQDPVLYEVDAWAKTATGSHVDIVVARIKEAYLTKAFLLDLSDCGSVKTLPKILPPQLEELNLSHCTSLEQLPADWPQNLKYLSMHNCTALAIAPENLPLSVGL